MIHSYFGENDTVRSTSRDALLFDISSKSLLVTDLRSLMAILMTLLISCSVFRQKNFEYED